MCREPRVAQVVGSVAAHHYPIDRLSEQIFFARSPSQLERAMKAASYPWLARALIGRKRRAPRSENCVCSR
jgi:hypothetical protein